MFEDIIAAAKGEAPKATVQPEKEMENSGVRIGVIGVGGAGCNAVNRIYEGGIKSARTIAINTDGKHLNMIKSHKKILAGRNITRGLGAGGDLNMARKCAESDREMLRREIGENELVFLCAGMGGGTGTGAAPLR